MTKICVNGEIYRERFLVDQFCRRNSLNVRIVLQKRETKNDSGNVSIDWKLVFPVRDSKISFHIVTKFRNKKILHDHAALAPYNCSEVKCQKLFLTIGHRLSHKWSLITNFTLFIHIRQTYSIFSTILKV